MPTFRESRGPSVPNRSPFRIRDSQMAKMQQSPDDRWSFSMELVNMWNMKPVVVETYNDTNNKYHNERNMFSSGNLLTQLLVSQAILDSNDYKILSFEKIDKLKKEYLELHEHIKNLSKSIELENRIKNISKSLENINLKNSRNSIIYLQKQRQHNDHKINHLSTQLEDLKQKEIDMKKTILQHTAAVLNKGIQHIETSPTPTHTPTHHQHHYNDQVVLFESELDQISNRVNYLFARYCTYTSSAPKKSVDKLLLLDQQLSNKPTAKSQTSKRKAEKVHQNKAQLLAIEHERNFLLSKLVDMELKSTKLLSTMSLYSNKQRALKLETLQFKGESIELQLWDKVRQRDEDIKQIIAKETNNNNIPADENSKNDAMISNYKKQLDDQSKFYESNIKQQNASLETNSRMHEQLEADCNKLTSMKAGLDDLVKEKSRKLDEQDNQISRLHEAIRNQQIQAQRSPAPTQPNRLETKEEKDRLKKAFAEKETQWTEHTHSMEDSFDELLENFDKLTNTAMDFDSKRMKYDRQIEQLNQTVHNLEVELIDEKVKKIGYGQGEAPTTASLRKEFRLLVAEIKKTHQHRMDQEAEEITRLKEQLEELQNSSNNKYTTNKYQHSMSVQTDF